VIALYGRAPSTSRRSAPLARISPSTSGIISPSGTGDGTATRSSGRAWHCAALKTVNRLRREEGDGYGLVARLARATAFVVRNRAVGIDDGRAAFALPHIAAKTERLATLMPE
jgi:hypothetical protein